MPSAASVARAQHCGFRTGGIPRDLRRSVDDVAAELQRRRSDRGVIGRHVNPVDCTGFERCPHGARDERDTADGRDVLTRNAL